MKTEVNINIHQIALFMTRMTQLLDSSEWGTEHHVVRVLLNNEDAQDAFVEWLETNDLLEEMFLIRDIIDLSNGINVSRTDDDKYD